MNSTYIDTVSVQICTGTTCYVMGASELLMLEEHIPAEQAHSVRISGSTCLGLCRNRSMKPPFVRINDKIISKATLEKVLDAITAETEGGDYAYDE